MAINSERSFNEALARVLRTKHPRWRRDLTAEQHRAVKGGGLPDLIVRNPRGAPVVVESEYAPARTVEQDALARLGRELADSGDAIEQCFALRAPAALRHAPQAALDERTARARYEYCLFSAAGAAGPVRWPAAGWIAGGVDDLAAVIESASISERAVARSLDVLETGIAEAAVRLREAAADRPAVNERIAATLRQEDGEQTSRMAMAIVANALTFQTMLAGVHDVRTLDDLRRGGVLPKAPVLREWERILRINYWPIFHVAREVLAPIPDGTAAGLLARLAGVSSELDAHGVTRSHDLYGRTFQRLISDRKFLATFYTRPESAALLAELAVGLLDADWRDPGALTGLRACDFACGTGTLITAACHALLARHRRAGGDDAAIHRGMLERAIFAADIMPAATHLTTSMLSSAHPTTPFERTQVHLLPYGRQDGPGGAPEEFRLGALDLIRAQHGTGLFERTGIEVHHGTAGTAGVDRQGEGWSDTFLLAHRSMDLVIMNPPFTRPTNHEAADVPVPSFAGLGNDDAEQAAMSRLLKTIREDVERPAGHGNAGLASNFLDLAEAKVRPGGVLALVMPLSLLQGNAWAASRDLLRSRYEETTVISLASAGRDDRKSFSADTGMGEVLVIARRRKEAGGESASVPEAPARSPAASADETAASGGAHPRADVTREPLASADETAASGWESAPARSPAASADETAAPGGAHPRVDVTGEPLASADETAAPGGGPASVPDAPVTFVALRRRPASATEAAGLAAAIRDAARRGRSRILLGDDLCGTRVVGTWDDGGCASVAHPEVVDAVRGLRAGALTLPRTNDTHRLPVTPLGALGTRGLIDRDINGVERRARSWGKNVTDEAQDTFRGPFDVVSIRTAAPTFPVLWGHDADRERRLIVQPDREGVVRDRAAERAADAWGTATRLHFNRDFRLNSQSLAACLTPTSTLGGRAWPNFLLTERRHETVTVLWANTTPGLMLFWWQGSVQQAGRACLTVSRLPDLPVLDPRALTDAQHARARDLLGRFRERPFLPANEAYRDRTRQALDAAVLVELLGLPASILEPLAVLRTQWCGEPTVHGGKATRPAILTPSVGED